MCSIALVVFFQSLYKSFTRHPVFHNTGAKWWRGSIEVFDFQTGFILDSIFCLLWFWYLDGISGQDKTTTYMHIALFRSWYANSFHGDGAAGPCGSHLLAAGHAGLDGQVISKRRRFSFLLWKLNSWSSPGEVEASARPQQGRAGYRDCDSRRMLVSGAKPLKTCSPKALFQKSL